MESAEIVRLAERAETLRRNVSSEAELLEAISPATPDRVTILDAERSVFRAEWWIGNSDARRVAEEDIAVMRALVEVAPLTDVESDAADESVIGFCFYLEFMPETVSEAIN